MIQPHQTPIASRIRHSADALKAVGWRARRRKVYWCGGHLADREMVCKVGEGSSPSRVEKSAMHGMQQPPAGDKLGGRPRKMRKDENVLFVRP
jgi:hypothetical protein